jgi:hypothetical protein
MGEPTNTPCVVCGAVPTRVETIQRHVGMIVLQRFVRLKQPLCKTHGNEITHQYLAKTAREGWWGLIAFFVNIYVVGHDLLVLRRFDALDDPRPVQPGQAGQAGQAGPPAPAPLASQAVAPAPAPVADQPAPAPPTVAEPGWYPDPAGRFEHRWHDGRQWTANVAREGRQFADPLAAS